MQNIPTLLPSAKSWLHYSGSKHKETLTPCCCMWCESKYFITFVSRKPCTETQEAPLVVNTALSWLQLLWHQEWKSHWHAHTQSRDVPAVPVPLSWSTFTGAHWSTSALWETTECIQDGTREHRFCTSASGGFPFIFYLFGRKGLGKVANCCLCGKLLQWEGENKPPEPIFPTSSVSLRDDWNSSIWPTNYPQTCVQFYRYKSMLQPL